MAQMIMPLMGGTPRAFLDKGATAPAWSPDGTHLAYFKNDDGDPLFVADRSGADARKSCGKRDCTVTILSGRQTVSGSTSRADRTRPTRWTCGAFDLRAGRRSD